MFKKIYATVKTVREEYFFALSILTQLEHFLPGQLSINAINAVYYKTDYNLTFSIKKYNSVKSYYTEDWTVHALQLHRLLLLPVTGEQPHTKWRAKSPICQDLDDRDTDERKEKEKREVRLPTIIAVPQL